MAVNKGEIGIYGILRRDGGDNILVKTDQIKDDNYNKTQLELNKDVSSHILDKNNPHKVTKDQIGLNNVTNDAQVKRSELGQPNGVLQLDENGSIPKNSPLNVLYTANDIGEYANCEQPIYYSGSIHDNNKEYDLDIGDTKQKVENINDFLLNYINDAGASINSVTRIHITPTSSESYSTSYKITQGDTAFHNLTEIGTINIPKDMVISSGSLKTATQSDVTNNLYDNIKIGDKYIDLVIANSNNDHIYIPVTDLVDTYLAGDGLSISNYKFSIKKDVTSENYLNVSSNGLKISGIDSRFNNIEPTVNKLSEIYNEKPVPSFKLNSASITITNNSNVESKINVDLSKQSQIIQIVRPNTIKINCSIKINTDNCKEIIRTTDGLNTNQTEYTFDKTYTTSGSDNQNTIYGINESIYCNKSGLMVNGSKVIPATGEDSNTFKLGINFKWKYYLGVSTNDEQYQTLIDTSTMYSTKKDITINNVSTNNNQYYVYIYPKIFGELTSVIQNGALPVLDAFNKTEITIKNEYGLEELYYVYKSNNPKPFTNSNLTFK